MYFERSGPPVTPRDIERVERLVGCSLPTPYREFLLKHNGGVPRPSGFIVAFDDIGPIDECVEILHSINRGTYHNDLETAIRLDRDSRQPQEHFEIPSDAIWIGSAMAGEIVLFVKGARAGQVWFKRAVDDHNQPMEGMYLLAPTFDDFLNMLKPSEWDPPAGVQR